jgi:endonuclease/exonuclease/phosphatase family metal-dependent hydrolase
MRVVTWNINGGVGLTSVNPRSYATFENLLYIVEHLKSFNADIICLQEVHVSAERSQTKLIAEELDCPYTFETIASDSHIDSACKLTNAVISRQPFNEAKAVCLPRPEFLLELPLLPKGQRAEIHNKYMQVLQYENFTLANIHTLPLHVLGTSYDSGDGRAFAKEVKKVMLEHLSTPLIFCGDFNHTDIQNLYPNLFNKPNLLDALPNEPSVPNADMRIDHVLISKNDFQIVDRFIHPLMIDHYPCLLELFQSPK